MILNDTNWYRLIQIDTEWYRIISIDTDWYRLISTDTVSQAPVLHILKGSKGSQGGEAKEAEAWYQRTCYPLLSQDEWAWKPLWISVRGGATRNAIDMLWYRLILHDIRWYGLIWMILNDIILHDSQEFAAALEAQAKSKKDQMRKPPKKNANGKKKVISDDTEWYWMIWNDID